MWQEYKICSSVSTIFYTPASLHSSIEFSICSADTHGTKLYGGVIYEVIMICFKKCTDMLWMCHLECLRLIKQFTAQVNLKSITKVKRHKYLDYASPLSAISDLVAFIFFFFFSSWIFVLGNKNVYQIGLISYCFSILSVFADVNFLKILFIFWSNNWTWL